MLVLIFGILISSCYSQDKDELKEKRFEQQIDTIVEELKFNYDYDQALREYIVYKTFNKAITDSIENLESEQDRLNYIFSTNFKSDIAQKIWEEFIHPSDDKFTERLIAITDSVGYPSLSRIKKYYKPNLPEGFNPTIFFIHSNKKYWSKINQLAEREFKNGNMGKCDYGYIKWHTSERKENKYLDENGIEYATNSDGRAVFIRTCED
ncbi:hypothetical protein E7Z59_10310 [Robertkochia marina]|uniref:Uncharacterized protein n=1 Tax=Robertkochia marina TaxID=1227945 RepID=A0A4S3M0S3_9FLAO|nr:hypothetical protein [Robertkochia marina]THD68030.1 hypothetical protein E7Z59_10310 [Robertkochia marina]